MQHRLQNIIFWAGQAAPKVDWPAGTSTCSATLLNNGEIGHCPKHNLPSGASQGLVQLPPLPFIAEFTYNLQWGKWLCCTLIVSWNLLFTQRHHSTQQHMGQACVWQDSAKPWRTRPFHKLWLGSSLKPSPQLCALRIWLYTNRGLRTDRIISGLCGYGGRWIHIR